MKRPSREINLFSLSALDLFASAMGTFILLTVVLFPYYLKNSEIVEKMSILRQELEKTQQQLQECTTQRQQCEAQRSQLEQQLQECQTQQANQQDQIDALQQDLSNCEEKLKKTFLAVVMKWSTSKQDVDLHVIDTEDHEFYYSKHNRDRSHFPNSGAELSVDTTKGPGIEIWENPLAKLGTYKIYANLYSLHGNSENPVIKTNVYYRDGSKQLREVTLTQVGQKKLIATVEVNAEGDVVVH